nr:complement C3-like [Globicephala melas]
MDVPWLLGLILLLLGSPVAHAEPLYILVTPRVLRVGSPENIHVQAHSDSREPLTRTLKVNLTVWDFPMKKMPIPESLVYPPQPGTQYVIIQATWAPTSASALMEKLVLVAPHAGYIFIQTDKTIYTPEQLVQYRVYTVNHRMDPVPRTFTLDIKNPEGITVISQDFLARDSVFANSFHLPELISLGTWSIEARYQSAPKQKFKATFEVKEFALPSFEVQLTPNKTFFYLNDEALGVNIQARYIFNKPVDGHALAIFGVKQDSHRIPIQSSLQKVEIFEGLGHVSLQKGTLMATFQGPEEDFIGASIFVNVTVFSTGGEMVQAETSGVKIVQSPYNIKFTRTPQYFKPGMPFHFRVFVSNPDGSPASKVLVRCQNHKVHTSSSGVATLTINTNGDLKELPILDGSGNFLHIEVKTLGAEVGSNIQLSLNTKHQNPEAKDWITHFTILVLSKGQIVYAKHQLKSHGSIYTSAIIDVTSEMLPSFRILAFYLLPRGTGQDPELVADSIWIPVNDKCKEKLKVGMKNEGYLQPVQPSSQVELKVTGDAEATVGLVAVDKAVYILNSKHKLTQKKVWDTVEEHDIGCTAGSGKDRLAVFKDAGLDMKMSTGMDTLASSDWHCPQSPSPSRHRRSLKSLETKRNAVNKFETELERKCCEAGLRESPVGLSCVERTHHVRYGPVCIAAFLSCCHVSEALSREAREEQLLLGTMDEDEDFDDIFQEDQPVRSLFPESWFWKKITLPKSESGISHYSTRVTVPDSITTWKFVAVSVKAGQGLCVSDPFELTVMKSFFVDLKLPFSVIRNEQVQIQAVLYNFRVHPVKVRVEFPHKEPLCSAAKPGAPSRQAGGQIQQISHSILLNPQGHTQMELVPKQDFLNKMPNTEAEVFVSIQGYSRMLTHRSADSTYHTSKGNPGSTWLTSYVFRVFALAYPTMTMGAFNPESLCTIANWIVTQRQAKDGSFLEESPVVMGSMKGGYRGSEANVSLTALVLIALNEGKELCNQKIPNLAASMKQASDFLEKKLPHIQTTFAVAIVSYALALTRSSRANDRLDSVASQDKTHWPVDDLDMDSLYTIEATAYALMQKLELGRHNETHAIAKWLLEKRELGGGFQSTQVTAASETGGRGKGEGEGEGGSLAEVLTLLARRKELSVVLVPHGAPTTVVAIEALTRFREAVPFDGVQDLRVQIRAPKRALNMEWLIDENNAYQLRSAKFSAQDDLEIKASGSGRGTISILTMYHRSPESWEDTCNLYHLNVTLHTAPKDNKKGEATFQLRMETRKAGSCTVNMHHDPDAQG